MKNALRNVWNNEAGFVVTVELILVATITVIGLVTGLTILRDAVVAELSDTAAAFGSISQSFSVAGLSYDGVAAAGASGFADGSDVVDSAATVTSGIGSGTPIATIAASVSASTSSGEGL